jgi:predicted  nucleic acid-binding Zn-ribbon protein
VILPTDVNRMLDVAHEILCRGLAGAAQERHEVDADDTALIRKQLEFGIGFIARQRRERRAAGVRDRNRCLGCGNRLPRGALAAVRKVDQDICAH